MKRPEDALQAALADLLRRCAKHGVVWWHTPNGARLGGKSAAATWKRLEKFGARAGVSDLVLFHEANLFVMELKAPGGRATEHQLQFIDDVREQGGFTAVCDSFERAVACLNSWGLLKVKVG